MPITYASSQPDYTVGQLIDMREWNGVSRVLHGAVVIPFGAPVVAHASADYGCSPLTATGQNVIGIARLNHVLFHEGDEYRENDVVSVIDEGPIAVRIGAAGATKGAQARWDTVNLVWTGAAASATVFTIPGAQFEFNAAANAIGVVRYKRPIPSLSA